VSAGGVPPARRGRRVQPDDSRIGARLRALRLRAGLTQVELAQRIGCTHQQLQKYETGANRLAAGRLMRLAEALDCSPAELLESEAPKRPRGTEARIARLFELVRSLPRRDVMVLLAVARLLAERGPVASDGDGDSA
jgi:transcriptional regulator with XRE-family HTH domain